MWLIKYCPKSFRKALRSWAEEFLHNSEALGWYPYQPSRRLVTAHEFSLDPQYSYFLLYASYGDKWVILSYLKKFLELQQNARIIAAPEDRELIRIFVGLETLSRQFIFIDSHTIKKFSDEIGPLSASTAPLWVDYSSLDQTRAVLKLGFPAGGIRHLHIVKYPYFSDLILVHGVSYSTLIKTFLYLPSKVKPAKPIYYNDNDRRGANDIINNLINKSVKSVIFNTVNFSHEPFSIHQIDVIIREFESENIQVLVNVTQMLDPSSLDGMLSNSKMAKSFTIPGHLYDLIIEEVSGVFGVTGGAMSIACVFSTRHIINLWTTPRGFDYSFDNLFGGKDIWKLYDEDFKCLFPGRIVEDVQIGKLSELPDAELQSIVRDFARKISSH